jgi:hypothetical protein
VLLGHVAFSDRDQAPEPRLRVEQAVVVRGVHPRVDVVAVRHPADLIEEAMVALLDPLADLRSEVGESAADHHGAGGEPCGVHEGEELARPLERGRVVEVEEHALPGLEVADGLERGPHAGDGLLPVDEPELVGPDDRDHVETYVRDARVVADLPGQGIVPEHMRSIGRPFWVAQRGEPPPGIPGHAP